MHIIKFHLCALEQNASAAAGNETDHILRTNSETNFGLLGRHFYNPRLFVSAPFVAEATLRVDISQVAQSASSWYCFLSSAICMAPGTNRPFE
jgi:hypothetical protein